MTSTRWRFASFFTAFSIVIKASTQSQCNQQACPSDAFELRSGLHTCRGDSCTVYDSITCCKVKPLWQLPYGSFRKAYFALPNAFLAQQNAKVEVNGIPEPCSAENRKLFIQALKQTTGMRPQKIRCEAEGDSADVHAEFVFPDRHNNPPESQKSLQERGLSVTSLDEQIAMLLADNPSTATSTTTTTSAPISTRTSTTSTSTSTSTTTTTSDTTSTTISTTFRTTPTISTTTTTIIAVATTTSSTIPTTTTTTTTTTSSTTSSTTTTVTIAVITTATTTATTSTGTATSTTTSTTSTTSSTSTSTSSTSTSSSSSTTSTTSTTTSSSTSTSTSSSSTSTTTTSTSSSSTTTTTTVPCSSRCGGCTSMCTGGGQGLCKVGQTCQNGPPADPSTTEYCTPGDPNKFNCVGVRRLRRLGALALNNTAPAPSLKRRDSREARRLSGFVLSAQIYKLLQNAKILVAYEHYFIYAILFAAAFGFGWLAYRYASKRVAWLAQAAPELDRSNFVVLLFNVGMIFYAWMNTVRAKEKAMERFDQCFGNAEMEPDLDASSDPEWLGWAEGVETLQGYSEANALDFVVNCSTIGQIYTMEVVAYWVFSIGIAFGVSAWLLGRRARRVARLEKEIKKNNQVVECMPMEGVMRRSTVFSHIVYRGEDFEEFPLLHLQLLTANDFLTSFTFDLISFFFLQSFELPGLMGSWMPWKLLWELVATSILKGIFARSFGVAMQRSKKCGLVVVSVSIGVNLVIILFCWITIFVLLWSFWDDGFGGRLLHILDIGVGVGLVGCLLTPVSTELVFAFTSAFFWEPHIRHNIRRLLVMHNRKDVSRLIKLMVGTDASKVQAKWFGDDYVSSTWRIVKVVSGDGNELEANPKEDARQWIILSDVSEEDFPIMVHVKNGKAPSWFDKIVTFGDKFFGVDENLPIKPMKIDRGCCVLSDLPKDASDDQLSDDTDECDAELGLKRLPSLLSILSKKSNPEIEKETSRTSMVDEGLKEVSFGLVKSAENQVAREMSTPSWEANPTVRSANRAFISRKVCVAVEYMMAKVGACCSMDDFGVVKVIGTSGSAQGWWCGAILVEDFEAEGRRLIVDVLIANDVCDLGGYKAAAELEYEHALSQMMSPVGVEDKKLQRTCFCVSATGIFGPRAQGLMQECAVRFAGGDNAVGCLTFITKHKDAIINALQVNMSPVFDL